MLAPTQPDAAVGGRAVIRPHDHPSAIPLLLRIGLDAHLRAHVGGGGVGHIGVFALVVAAHAHQAAARRTRSVQHRLVSQADALTPHINLAAHLLVGRVFGAGHDAAGALHPSVARRLQAHAAALYRDGISPDLAAVLEGAGKNTHRITAELAQVEGLVGRGLHLKADAFEPAPGDFNPLAGRQQSAAVGGLDEGVFAGVDVGCDQHRVAAARQDAALHRDAGGGHGGIAKAQPPRQGVGIAHAQGRGGKTSGIHQSARAHGNAGLVDQHQVPVAGQRAKQL